MMVKCAIALRHVERLFKEKDSWETREILDRLITDISPRYVPTQTQLHRVMLKGHSNVRGDKRNLALWMKKVQKEKLVEVTE
tara:strand:- start:18342 stop:18587 length:246 start_codon:yes stop_codon:yes gene_type:complete